MKWVNTREKEAEENGYVVLSWYDTKDEVDHVLHQIHGCGARAMKAHHKEKNDAIEYDFWVLWIKKEDIHMLSADYVMPEKPPKPKPQRGGRRKDMAIKIVKMRKEEHKEWEDIAKELGRTVSTVQYYFYHYSSEKCRKNFTDWQDDRRPEGYDPETGLIKPRTNS